MPQPDNADAILERLPDPVLVVEARDLHDPSDRHVVFANPAARAVLRIPDEGAPLTSAVRHPRVLAAVDEGLAGRAADIVYEAAGAQPRWWGVIARPLPAPSGLTRTLLVLRDETDARRSERMRADFLANASHELRTPLASLSGFIETLRGHAKDDPAARDRFLGIMAAQAGRMTRLIEDLLSLSRVELNEHIAPSGRVDIAAATLDVINAAAPVHTASQVSVDPFLPQGGVDILGDRDQVLQVLQNLIDNAVKYTSPGGQVRVTVAPPAPPADAARPQLDKAARLTLLSPDQPVGRYVAVHVADDGPGIARQNLPRLSERFYRVEGQKSGERLGTGLGLAIVKHIMNRHRGGLIVESAEGVGTVFTAYFPAA